MTFSLDIRDKAALYPERYGYQRRGTLPVSIVVHSTEGKKGQTFSSAASYLYHSADVSAHFLVGRAGEIQQHLDPKKYQAWHAGPAIGGFTNSVSIGIECLHARGEDWPSIQIAALAWLCEHLMRTYSIAHDRIETHRKVALPSGRKVDPTDWPNEMFYAWRAALTPVLPPTLDDPFAEWGPIARPEGDARGWAVPRVWLMNKRALGACRAAEYYAAEGVSFTVFEKGFICYQGKPVDRATVHLF